MVISYVNNVLLILERLVMLPASTIKSWADVVLSTTITLWCLVDWPAKTWLDKVSKR